MRNQIAANNLDVDTYFPNISANKSLKTRAELRAVQVEVLSLCKTYTKLLNEFKYLEVQKRFYVNFMNVPMDNTAEWFYNGHDNDRMGTF